MIFTHNERIERMQSINIHVTLFPFLGSAPGEKYDQPIFTKVWRNVKLSPRFIEDLVHQSISLNFDRRHQNQSAKVTRYNRLKNMLYAYAKMSSPSVNYVAGLKKDGWTCNEERLRDCGLPVSEACAEQYKPQFESYETLTLTSS